MLGVVSVEIGVEDSGSGWRGMGGGGSDMVAVSMGGGVFLK